MVVRKMLRASLPIDVYTTSGICKSDFNFAPLSSGAISTAHQKQSSDWIGLYFFGDIDFKIERR
jgi:hypothetical protein